MTLSTQLATMLAMILGGIYMGLGTDTYKRIKHIWQANKSLRIGLEIIYWLVQTFILYATLYYVNNGEIRFYIFLSLLCGYSIYVVLLQKAYRFLLEKIIRFIKVCARFIYKVCYHVLYQPLKAIFLFLYRVAQKLLTFSLIVCKYTLIILFLPFRWVHFILQKILPIKIIDKYNKALAFCSTIISKFIAVWKRVFTKGG